MKPLITYTILNCYPVLLTFYSRKRGMGDNRHLPPITAIIKTGITGCKLIPDRDTEKTDKNAKKRLNFMILPYFLIQIPKE
jgi:hypothetical protein